MLNGPQAILTNLQDLQNLDVPDDKLFFMRPIDDSKEEPGRVWRMADLQALSAKVCALPPDDIPFGALRHDTELMLCSHAPIQKEWRIWIVKKRVVTISLYGDGSRVIYKPDIDPDALAFAKMLVTKNPDYSDAYVLDICRTEGKLMLLETNCINAAGSYAAALDALVTAISGIGANHKVQ